MSAATELSTPYLPNEDARAIDAAFGAALSDPSRPNCDQFRRQSHLSQ
jgi:hypothetical protein